MIDQQKEWEKSIKLLAEVNKLSLDAFQAKSISSLIFLILNDTISVVSYDRAVLWKIKNNNIAEILGISGQASVKKNTELYYKWNEVVHNITEPEKIQLIAHPNIAENTSILWVPIVSNERVALGLWLERWKGIEWNHEDIEIIAFLSKSYGSAWAKFNRGFSFSWFRNKFILISSLLLLTGLMFLKIPLRIVAPCEVVPEDPYVITTPLEGVIEKISVKPAEIVKKGTVLFEYDSKVPLQDLLIAQKKVEISQAEVNRVNSLAYSDKKSLNELAIETLQLKKDKLDLELAKYRASELQVESPIDGVVMMDNPEEWHGRYVKIGEKVMIVSDPNKTKLRMWIPEGDNVLIDKKKPIKIVLNVRPHDSLEAKILYISDYTIVTDKSVTSFVAEAEWMDEDKDIKLGLKGSAILYGEKVTIFYWIIRKPLSYVRHLLGI